jgi:acetyltransferase-like isoleucine patch superfamily enzyme
MFLKGSSIGDGTIVASGAVVSKAFGSNKIIAGIPAKEISSNHQWDV